MRLVRWNIGLVSGVLLLPAPGTAHHAFTGVFDMDRLFPRLRLHWGIRWGAGKGTAWSCRHQRCCRLTLMPSGSC